MVHGVKYASIFNEISMDKSSLTIGQLADQSEVSIDTVKYYHKQGLLFAEKRNEANYRIYSEVSVERIKFIKRAQALGFKLSEIKELLNLDSSGISPSTFDYITKKLSEVNANLSELTSRKHNLEKLIHHCDSVDECNLCELYNYLDNINISPSSELVFCRHSYLFDTGKWTLEGNFHINGSSSVDMTGTVDIRHENNLWHVTRVLNLNDEENTSETIDFYIPPSPQEDITTKFIADCSVFGDVKGSIAFAGEDIFKHYEMPEQKVHGHEYLKRVHTDLYEARGVLSDGTKSITWWDYNLERGNKNFDS